MPGSHCLPALAVSWALPVPLAACRKVYLCWDFRMTWLLPFEFRVPVRSSSRNQLEMLYERCLC